MFKYLQRFAIIEKTRYVFKAFQEENLTKDGWVKYIKNKTGAFGVKQFYEQHLQGDKWGNLKREIPVKT